MEQFARNINCNSNNNNNNNNNMDNNNYITSERSVEDITNQMNCMNVDMIGQMVLDRSEDNCNSAAELMSQDLMEDSLMIARSQQNEIESANSRDSAGIIRMDDSSDHNEGNPIPNSSDILIVTNVDPAVFYDSQMRQKFESLFLAYQPDITFRYLKSFRRVRIDFNNTYAAERARANLSHYNLGSTSFRCYAAQIIKPNSNFNNTNSTDDNNHTMFSNSTYLNIPKLTKQFLISPPASPPVGWEPVSENLPSIDVQLMSAIANLVPGQIHEIHPASDSQPGIFVEVCEDPQFESSRKSCSRTIPRTKSPGYCQ